MRMLNAHDHLWDEEGNTVKLLLQKMDQFEIETTCITYGERHLWQDYDPNDFIEEAFNKHPDRLLGMGWINLGVDGPEKVRQLKERGFVGLKFIYPQIPYNDERAFPIYFEAEKLKMPCLFHLGPVKARRGPRFSVDSSRMEAGMLDLVARECPDLPVIGAHLGWINHNEAWALARMHPNLYLDTSGNGNLRTASRKYFENNILGWVETFPKFIFGTDQYYQGWDDEIATTLNMLDNVWQVDAGTKKKILYGNLDGILKWAGAR